MKIISNDLYCQIERWDDPGDYPNGLAAGPLPSYSYCEFGGEFVFETENDEELKELDNVDDWIGDWVRDQCDIGGHIYPSYRCEVEGNRCVVTITEAEVEEYDPADDY
ncbi:hypothetical protein EBZ39_11690 [bacterium]|nr:hypothetical protein [bacterium]